MNGDQNQTMKSFRPSDFFGVPKLCYGGTMKTRSDEIFPLILAKEGESLIISDIRGGKFFKDKCISMGIIPGVKIEISNNSRGGPCLMKIGDSRIIIGGGMMHRIFVKRT